MSQDYQKYRDFENRVVDAIQQRCGPGVVLTQEVPLKNGVHRSRADLVVLAPPFLYVVELKNWTNASISTGANAHLQVSSREGGAPRRYPDPRQQLRFMADHLLGLRNRMVHPDHMYADELPAWCRECMPQLVVVVDDSNEVAEGNNPIPLLTLSKFLERLPQQGPDIGIGPEELRERVAQLEDLASELPIGKVATNHHVQGLRHFEEGEYEQARKCFEKALAIKLNVYGELHADVASSYHDLGVCHHERGEVGYKQARDCLEKGLAIRLQLYGEEHARVGLSYYTLAVLYDEHDELDLAREYYEKSLAVRLNISGDQDSEVGEVYLSLGYLLRKQGKHDLALEYFEKWVCIKAVDDFKKTGESDLLKELLLSDGRDVAVTISPDGGVKIGPQNPFVVGTPVAPGNQVGRTKLTDAILRGLNSQRASHHMLTGPRRFGKTSLLKKIAAKLEEEGRVVEWIDVVSCPAEDRHKVLLEALSREPKSDRVLMIDEADALWSEVAFSEARGEQLLRLREALSSTAISTCMAATVPIRFIERALGSTYSSVSPVGNIFANYSLEPLSHDALTSLYSREFPDEDFVEKITEFAFDYLGGHPFYSQVLGADWWDRSLNGDSFDPVKAKELLKDDLPTRFMWPSLSGEFSEYLLKNDFKPLEMPRRFREESDQLFHIGLFRRRGTGIEPLAPFVREILVPAIISDDLPIIDPVESVDVWSLFYEVVNAAFTSAQLADLFGLPTDTLQRLETSDDLRDFLSQEFPVASVKEVLNIVMGERDRRKLAQYLDVEVGETGVDAEELLDALKKRGRSQ